MYFFNLFSPIDSLILSQGFCNAHGGHNENVDMISLLPQELVKPLSNFLNILIGIYVGILCGNEDYQLVLFDYQKTKVISFIFDYDYVSLFIEHSRYPLCI